jgi:acetate kinase
MRLLTINTGSSSLKAAVYRVDAAIALEVSAKVERIGTGGSRTLIADADNATLVDRREDAPNHDSAIEKILAWLARHRADEKLDAVGHRVVHGGSRHRQPTLITPEVLTALQALRSIDPDHMPQAVAAIHTVGRIHPTIQQVACFDTAFHQGMPWVARTYPLPRELDRAGVVRYGFHGLSCEYVMGALRDVDSAAADGRVVIAHLGSGASMTAVHRGTVLDTTMGFTPTGGLMMGTRSGDLDPGVLLYLLESKGQDAASLSRLVNRESGLLGVSETSGDMGELLAKEPTDPRAGEAISLFCYQARKFLGALAAVLGGIDTLVFTGGIGERAAPVRARICTGLGFLGIELDADRNAQHAPVISRDGGAVVRVIKTDEDLTIARHVQGLAARGEVGDVRL